MRAAASSRPGSTVLPLLAVLALALLPSPAGEADELVKKTLKVLDEAVDDDKPERAQAALGDLDALWEEAGESARKKIVKGVDALLKAKPRNVQDDDGRGPEMRWGPVHAMAIGLVFDKPGGDDVLRRALKARHLQEWGSVRAMLFEGLSFGADPKDLALILGGLGEGSPEVVSAAARALGNYEKAPVAVRREAIAGLLGAWERLEEDVAKAERRRQGEGARELLADVEPALADGTTALARRRLRSLAEARVWFDEHGAGDDW